MTRKLKRTGLWILLLGVGLSIGLVNRWRTASAAQMGPQEQMAESRRQDAEAKDRLEAQNTMHPYIVPYDENDQGFFDPISKGIIGNPKVADALRACRASFWPDAKARKEIFEFSFVPTQVFGKDEQTVLLTSISLERAGIEQLSDAARRCVEESLKDIHVEVQDLTLLGKRTAMRFCMSPNQ